jgi:hypothetical protein
MTFDLLLPAFTRELVKLGFQSMRREPVAAKVDRHFTSTFPDWKSFEKNLRTKSFRELAKGHEKADPKLKKYIQNFGGYLASKDEVAKLRSKDSGTTYVIKDLHTGRLGCNCGDWQYKKSVRGGDCKHIKSLKSSKMMRKESAWDVLLTNPITTGATLYGATRMAKKHWVKGKAISEVEKQVSEEDKAKREARNRGLQGQV